MFKIPEPFTINTPFRDMHYTAWARKQPNRGKAIGMTAYLDSLGFVPGQDQLSEEQYEILKHAIDSFVWSEPHMPGKQRMRELFRPAKDNESSYSVHGWEPYKGKRMTIRSKLYAAIVKAGWIYSVHPGSTYFEYIPSNKHLIAKYQTIIGSRIMAVIGEKNE